MFQISDRVPSPDDFRFIYSEPLPYRSVLNAHPYPGVVHDIPEPDDHRAVADA